MIGLGLTWLVDLIRERSGVRTRRAFLAVPVIAGLVIAGSAAFTYPEVNHRGRTVVSAYVDDILRTLPPNAVLLAAGDETVLPVLHGLVVDQKRPDVRLIITPLLAADWYTDNLRHNYPDLVIEHQRYVEPEAQVVDLVSANPDRTFYQIGGLGINNAQDLSLEGHYYFVQEGLLNRVAPYAENITVPQVEANLERLYAEYSVPSPEEIRSDRTSFEPRILANYAAPFGYLGHLYAEGGRPQEARAHFERALQIDPHNEYAQEQLAGLP
ncbi:MAG TPA: tetratricopeptide repeat protein [Propionibacterium sp.]|nr:tetratricopeptide repeat protein [Propionibacterium sp.]